jgi:hypothetical protein
MLTPRQETMSDERRAAYFRVSYRLIEDLLKLPPGHKIKGISHEFRGFDDEIVVIVEGPDLPIAIPGMELPSVCPKYEKDEKDGIVTVRFVGWK